MVGRVWATLEDGNIEIVSMEEKHLDECLELVMDYYFKYEKMSKISKLKDNPAAAREILEMFRIGARDGLSLAAIDKSKQKVVGCGFTKYEVNIDDDTYFDDMFKICTQKESMVFLQLEEKAWSAFNLFDFLGIDCYIELDFCVTLLEYRGRGILTKLTDVVVDMSKRLVRGEQVRHPIDDRKFGSLPVPKALFSICTNPISSKICSKYGFKEIKKLTYADILTDCINSCEDLSDTLYYEVLPLVDLKSF